MYSKKSLFKSFKKGFYFFLKGFLRKSGDTIDPNNTSTIKNGNGSGDDENPSDDGAQDDNNGSDFLGGGYGGDNGTGDDDSSGDGYQDDNSNGDDQYSSGDGYQGDNGTGDDDSSGDGYQRDNGGGDNQYFSEGDDKSGMSDPSISDTPYFQTTKAVLKTVVKNFLNSNEYAWLENKVLRMKVVYHEQPEEIQRLGKWIVGLYTGYLGGKKIRKFFKKK